MCVRASLPLKVWAGTHNPLPHYPPTTTTTTRQSRAFAAAASRDLGLRIYSYSLFHVFFEQYLGVAGDAVRMVGLPLLAVVGVAWGLGGSLAAAALLAVVLASLLLHLAGAMVLAGIQVGGFGGRGIPCMIDDRALQQVSLGGG